MNEELKKKYILAGKIAGEAREFARQMTKPGAKIRDICQKTEEKIRELGGEPAFPTNISINERAAHDTALSNDERVIKEGDLVKIDVGAHVDGYIGDTACSVTYNKSYETLIKAVENALSEAIKLCTPGRKLEEISATIEKIIKSYGYLPISNLTGHGLERFNLHAQPQILNVSCKTTYQLKEGQTIAIEPFATLPSGAGKIKDIAEKKIYMLINPKPVRNRNAKLIMNFAKRYNGLPFALRWLPVQGFGLLVALKELEQKNIIYDYPVLSEINKEPISQAEHTVIVAEEPIVTTEIRTK